MSCLTHREILALLPYESGQELVDAIRNSTEDQLPQFVDLLNSLVGIAFAHAQILQEGNPMHKYDVVRHDETVTTVVAERFEVDDMGDVRFYQDDSLTAFMHRPIAVVLEQS